MYPLDIFENRIMQGKQIKYASKIKLYDYQEEACNKAINAKNGIIIMPARFWKNTNSTRTY